MFVQVIENVGLCLTLFDILQLKDPYVEAGESGPLATGIILPLLYFEAI